MDILENISSLSFKLSRVDAALSRLLKAIRATVHEEIRHLREICQHAPWYLATESPRSMGIMIIQELEHNITRYVEVASEAIFKINKVLFLRK